MKVHLDDSIYRMQARGGITTIWNNVRPFLETAFELSFGNDIPSDVDVFISTYYRRAPVNVKSLVLVYDMIAEQYPLIGASHPDAVAKRLAIKEATKVVSISAHVAADVLRITGRAVDAVAYPGVSEIYDKTFPPSWVENFRKSATDGQPYVLVVGNRGLYKNVQALYQAWQFFDGKDVHKLVCIGGEREPSPADLAFDNRYPGTRIHNFANDDMMAVIYSGATMLVYPSLLEGFGLPPLEAIKCHSRVVCGATMLEILGEHGAFYCDVMRPKSIAVAMNVAAQPGNIRSLPNNYTWANMATVLIETIRSTAIED